MPFILSVRPADYVWEEEPVLTDTFRNKIFRNHCSIESCGWTPNFTVIVHRDRVLWEILSLLRDAGWCVDRNIRELSLPNAESGRPVYRQMAPWNDSPDLIADDSRRFQQWAESVFVRRTQVPEEVPEPTEGDILKMQPAAA